MGPKALPQSSAIDVQLARLSLLCRLARDHAAADEEAELPAVQLQVPWTGDRPTFHAGLVGLPILLERNGRAWQELAQLHGLPAALLRHGDPNRAL